MCPTTLEYGLKDSPHSTEWIDMHYKRIRESDLNNTKPFHQVCMPLMALEKANFKNKPYWLPT